jgi:tetratricopeptide (TPR) repeat protein
MTAHDYLDRLSDTVAEGGAAGFSSTYNPPPPVTAPDLFEDDLASSGSLTPPDPIAAPAAGAAKKVTVKTAPVAEKKKAAPLTIVAVAVAALVLAAGGWFAYSKFFGKPAYNAEATTSIIRQANSLAQKGKYDQAIAMLQDVKSDDPQYRTAANLIADLQKKKAQAAEMVDGRPAAVVYQENLTSGKQAFQSHDYDAAKKYFDAASRIKALPDDVRAMYEQAAQQVAKLDAAKGLFKEQKYNDAIANLQPLLQADPENQSIKRIITDAHFDLGATALSEEKCDEAIKEFDQVLLVDANDELAKRSKALAERYNGQPKDLLYKIYVKYLPLRKVS